MNYVNRLFYKIFEKFRRIYLNSNFYDKRISKISNNELIYKPSPHFLSSLIKYQKKKIKIDDYSFKDVWSQKNISKKEFNNLHNFYWLFSIDLKSSKQNIHFIISNWIKYNSKYNSKSWSFDLTAKRIIAWLSCHNLTYEENDNEYKKKFNFLIQKQTNHLINEINKSDFIDDKLVGCASIILVGLCLQDKKKYLSFGNELLKKISKFTLDDQ